MIQIRSAAVEDAGALLNIYSYYVEKTAITFEYVTPSAEEFAGRIAQTLKKYPYLVLVEDGEIKGYAYAGPFKTRAAYDRSVELSIYIDLNAQGRGLGRILYEALADELTLRGIENLYACIASPIVEDEYLTCDSQKFHSRLGFELAGTFHKCAYKFGRWYNMVWMEKLIGDHV